MGLIPVGAAIILAAIFYVLWRRERKTRIHYETPPIPSKKEFYILDGKEPLQASFNQWVLAGKSKVLAEEHPYLDSVVTLRFLGVSKGLSERALPLVFEVVFYFGDLRTVVMYSDNYESAMKGFQYAISYAKNLAHGEKPKVALDGKIN